MRMKENNKCIIEMQFNYPVRDKMSVEKEHQCKGSVPSGTGDYDGNNILPSLRA